MTQGVTVWWMLLCALAVFNALAWSVSARRLARTGSGLPPDILRTRRLLLGLSAVYMLGCAFRSILPMVDAPRICVVDGWLSRIVAGRSVATVAEICFIAQWALLMAEAGRVFGLRTASVVSRLLVPLIVLAQLCCWYAVLTTNYLLHFAENALWTVSAALLLACFVGLWTRVEQARRSLVTAGIVFAVGYIAFMLGFDLPMYLARWQADTAAARPYLSLAEGAAQVMERCIVTREWDLWRQDMVWLTLYFSIGVWSSIALAHVPVLRAKQ